jgi:hypothetical protein
MYEEFYGFGITPFSKTPDPAFLYMSRGHEAGDRNMENQNKKAGERNSGELPSLIYL